MVVSIDLLISHVCLQPRSYAPVADTGVLETRQVKHDSADLNGLLIYMLISHCEHVKLDNY